MARRVRNLARLGAVATLAVLSACTDARPAQSASQLGAAPSAPATIATTATTQPPPAPQRIGQPFTIGDVRLTLLSVQDPFPATAQVQPAPGNRLVSIKYEAVSQSGVSQSAAELPTVELRDAAGATYVTEHGRLSVVGGARTPGELPAGKRMESSVLFEVPAPATGLRAAFRSPTSPEGQAVTVTLD